jgi:replicative DNA helicase
LLFSIEMDRIQIGVRILSQNSGVPAFSMLDEHQKLAQTEWDAMFSASARMEKISLTVDDRPVTMAQIVDESHRWYASKVRAAGLETGLIVIDYLGLIQSEGEGENRNREVAKLAQGAKIIAKKLRVSVMLCAQLNREAARRGGEPELSDLRDSGEIEAAGDLIIFPYQWPRYENAEHELVMKPAKDEHEEAEDKFLVRKNKNGPKGAASVMWHPELMQYTGLEREEEPAHDTRPNYQDREGN